jgi:hypothetical protein
MRIVLIQVLLINCGVTYREEKRKDKQNDLVGFLFYFFYEQIPSHFSSIRVSKTNEEIEKKRIIGN